MAHIELQLPESLKKRVTDFIPEALAEVRAVCTDNGIDTGTKMMMERDVIEFLSGIRSEHQERADKINALLENRRLTAAILDSSKFYIIELFRHYCDIAMKWSLFESLIDLGTTDGRIFFRDWCAVVIMYLDATRKELEEVGTGCIEFEKQGRRFASYMLDSDKPGTTGVMPVLDKAAYIKGAFSKVKEWRELLERRERDRGLTRDLNILQFSKPAADATVSMLTNKGLRQSIEIYNRDNEVPVSEHYVRAVFRGIIAGVYARGRTAIGRTDDEEVFEGTGASLCRQFMLKAPGEQLDNITYANFLSALELLRDFKFIIDEQYIRKKITGKDGKEKYVYYADRKSYRVIASTKFTLPTYVRNEKGEIDKSTLAYLPQTERIKLTTTRRFVDGNIKPVIIDEGGRKLHLNPRPDNKYLIPEKAFKGVKNSAWDIFVILLCGATNMTEDTFVERICHKGNRMEKSRFIKNLPSFFEQAVQKGVIASYEAPENEGEKRTWKWKHIRSKK